MFPPSHQPLVDHLRSIVLTSIDVHAFLDDRVGARS